jgi:hypothetical protein
MTTKTKMGTVDEILHRDGYCCCGQDKGTPVIATLCPKHGSTVLNCGGTLEYALNDEMAALHFAATGCSCRQSPGDDPKCKVHHPTHRGGARPGAGRKARPEPRSKGIWCGQITKNERKEIMTLTPEERRKALVTMATRKAMNDGVFPE